MTNPPSLKKFGIESSEAPIRKNDFSGKRIQLIKWGKICQPKKAKTPEKQQQISWEWR